MPYWVSVGEYKGMAIFKKQKWKTDECYLL